MINEEKLWEITLEILLKINLPGRKQLKDVKVFTEKSAEMSKTEETDENNQYILITSYH